MKQVGKQDKTNGIEGNKTYKGKEEVTMQCIERENDINSRMEQDKRKTKGD